MANGQFNLGKQSGGVLSISFPDGVTNTEVVLPESGEVATKEATVDIYNSHIPMSNFASYHLIDGNLAVDNYVTTQGFNTTLYTGNGATQSINTGIDMATQWGDTAEEKFGGLVWIKTRNVTNNNVFTDTVRGATKTIYSDLTNAEAISTGGLTAFNNNGFSLGNGSGFNTSTNTHVSWNFQTTHRVSGTTNHGKSYTCHYNPYTGFTIVKYEGSGLVGHEIPHSLGRKLGIILIKDLSAAVNWWVNTDNGYMFLNTADSNTIHINESNDNSIVLNSTTGYRNTSANQYILYGWANSYFDEANKLIGNYEIGVYQGTGVAGNKVTTRGKPALVMVKRLDSTGNWALLDNQRGNGNLSLYANVSNAEANDTSDCTFESNSFTLTNTGINASGGQYLYMVVYDTNSNGGGSYYPKSTDNANVQVNNAKIPLAKGLDSNGVKNEIVIANETITGVTWEEGKNYPYRTTTGYGKSIHRPRYLKSELVRGYAGEQPEYFDVEKNKWFSCDAGSELVVNGDFSSGTTTGWTSGNGATLSINLGNLSVYNNVEFGNAYQIITTAIGKKYKVTGSINNITGLYAFIQAETSLGLYNLLNHTATSTGTFSLEFTAQTVTTYLKLQAGASIGNSAQFDNISVFPLEITPTTEIPESRNYMNHIVHADSQGNPLFVEELPKVKYENIIKADEFRGKNACTAWVTFDGTTTPVRKMDSHNVSKVIRTAIGTYDIYFENEMDNIKYSYTYGAGVKSSTWGIVLLANINGKKTNKISIAVNNPSDVLNNSEHIDIQIFGGKS